MATVRVRCLAFHDMPIRIEIDATVAEIQAYLKNNDEPSWPLAHRLVEAMRATVAQLSANVERVIEKG